MSDRRCPQCWHVRALDQFVGARGQLIKRCLDCRRKYARWATMSTEEKLASRVARQGLRTSGVTRVTFKTRSGNAKTGPIPVSITTAETCPPTCGFFGKGCYAEYHLLRHHWRNAERGLDWFAFCVAIRRLPAGQLWRHNEAGDLPGEGNRIDLQALAMLLSANKGRRGFTFTHKPVLASPRVSAKLAEVNRRAVATANRHGFAVNLSAESLEQADELVDLGIGPVTVVVGSTTTAARTPAGRRVVMCPAQTHGMNCADCELCAHPARKSIIGFRAHGQMKATVTQLVKLRRKSA